MTPEPVFTRGRVARSERPAAGSRTTAALLAATGLLLPAAALRAQTPGALDTDFNASSFGTTVYAVDYVADTPSTVKITVGGDRGLGEYLLGTGVPQTAFVFPAFGNVARIIYTIVPERFVADGNFIPNLLLGGSFGRVPGESFIQNIVRIMPDGTLDTAFKANIGAGANNFVTAILPLGPDDRRIVVGGEFTTFNNEPRKRIVRLQNNGSIDESFATGSNIDNDVLVLAESVALNSNGQVDGSTLVGGIFNHVAGQPYGKLCRLDANGNLDMSFHPSIDLRVLAILVQPDGKIVIGGDFTNVNGKAVSHIARLNYDGSLDPTFVASVTGVPNHDVNPTAVYVLKAIPGAIPSDTRIYVGGEFAQIDGVTRRYLGLISADGVLDTTFDPGTTVYDSVQSITPISFVDANLQTAYRVLVSETLGPRIGKTYQPTLIQLYGVVPGSNGAGSVTQQQAQPQVPKKAGSPRVSGTTNRGNSRGEQGYLW